MPILPRPSKAVLVTTELPIQTGGIGTFIWNFARLLKQGGHEVLIILANPTDKPRATWIEMFECAGIEVIYLFKDSLIVPPGYSWHQRVAELVTATIPDDADVVYFADWQAKGFDYVRKRRFRRERGPAVVTITHGCTRWVREGMRTFPTDEEHLLLDYAEAYTAQHSDYLVTPGQYMLDWVRAAGWKLPPDSHSRVINYPFFPTESASVPQTSESFVTSAAAKSQYSVFTAGAPENAILHNGHNGVLAPSVEARASAAALQEYRSGQAFRRIIFFGRIETRKGIELFVNGLAKLKGKPCMQSIEEVILLGGPGGNPYGSPNDVARLLAERLDHAAPVHAVSDLNTFEAQEFLAMRASDSLVVAPSLRENFPLTVIEASLLPGLNLLASTAGSIPEVLGPCGRDQLFEPFLAPYAQKLEQTLLQGVKSDDELGHYDWQRANEGWIAFHEEVVEFARARRAEDSVRPQGWGDHPVAESGHSIDVCVSYYNLGDYLPYLLKSLANQTTQDFNLIVVDDGSTDLKSRQVFQDMARQYQSSTWTFVTTPNGGLSAARNAGAAAGAGKYLIFLDGDDVVPPNMVEQFRDAIEVSGDDCLSCYFHAFRGEGWHDSYSHISFYHYVPAGPDLALGLVSNPFGGACCIVTREAFESIAGFTTEVSRYVGFEDYEFYVRLALAGWKLDVLPEYLLYYRIRDEGMFRTNDLYENKARVLRAYERHLTSLGLGSIVGLAAGAYMRLQEIDGPSKMSNEDITTPFLVNHVSGFLVWKAFRVKVRNQIARRFGLAIISGDEPQRFRRDKVNHSAPLEGRKVRSNDARLATQRAKTSVLLQGSKSKVAASR